MNYYPLKSFFDKHRNIVFLFLKTGRNDLNIITIILSEMYFAPPKKRFLEYCGWLFCSIFYPARLNYLSLGISQIQLRHWTAYGSLKCKRASLASFLTLLNPLSNYDMTYRLLGDCDRVPKKLLGAYRGEARTYHLAVYNYFLHEIDELYCKHGNVRRITQCKRLPRKPQGFVCI